MNFSFKAKLLGLCGFLASVSVMLAFVSYNGLHSVESKYDEVTDENFPQVEALYEMFLQYRAVRINLRTLGIPGLSNEESEKYIGNVKTAISEFEKFEKSYASFPMSTQEKDLFEKLQKSWSHFKGVGDRVLEHHKVNTADAREKMVQIFLKDCPDAAKDFTERVNDLKAYLSNDMKTIVTSAKDTGKRTNQIVLFASIAGILIGLIVGFLFSSKIASSLTNVAQQLSSNADQVAAASSQIASSSQQLSEASTEQASSLEETAASLEEITSMISKATENANTTSETSTESHKKAEEGRASVDQMLSSMDEISQSNEAILTQINESNRQMADIVKVIQDIGNRTKVINEIVFQTKLLSFNASVEAARAGEHGKGFAVVAEEVGNLAQMSGNAAKEITDMLDASISKVEGIVRDTQQKVESLVQSGKEKVESGVTVARQCSDVLNEIVQNVSRVSGLSQEISQAAKEQSQGVSEINKAMSQLDTVTQQNAATSEEAASAAEELSAQAESLKSSVEDLMAVISGNRSSVATSPAPSATQVSNKAQKSNIVHLKAAKPKAKKSSFAADSGVHKMASGDDSSTPDRDDDGFKDV